MIEVINNNGKIIPQGLGPILSWALILRVLLFFVVINSNNPFVIEDDIKYEEISRIYLQYANSLWDWNAVSATGGSSFLQVFWPYCICFFSKLLGTEYAGRILNIIFSLFIIYIVYDLTTMITKKHESGLYAAKLMAFLPYPLLFSVFNIKDFYIMLGVFYAFRLFVKWQYDISVSLKCIAIGVLLLIGVYYARGGVVEFVGIAFAAFLCNRYYQKKQYAYIVSLAAITAVVFFYLSDSIIGAFDTKLDVYDGFGLTANGLRMVQIHGIGDVYKMPLQYLFAILSPFAINYFSVIDNFSWLNLMTTLNVTLYSLGIAGLLFIFQRKQNILFWAVTFIIFIAITTMVLAIPRHYFFLFPMHVINYVCFKESATNTQIKIVKYGSIAMMLIVFVISIKTM